MRRCNWRDDSRDVQRRECARHATAQQEPRRRLTDDLTHVAPQPRNVAFTLAENRHRRVIGVNAFSGEQDHEQ